MKKLKDYFSSSTEQTFNFAYFIFAIIISIIAFYFGFTYLQLISVALLKVSIYFLSLSGFIKFLYNVKFDIMKEVFEQRNIASGVFLAGMAVGLAIVIAVTV